MPQHYTISEALSLLRVDQSTLNRWLKADNIHLASDLGDKRRKVISEQQLRWVAERRHIPLQLQAIPEANVPEDIVTHLTRLETELDALKRLGDVSMILASLTRIEDRLAHIEEQLQGKQIQKELLPAIEPAPEKDAAPLSTGLPENAVPYFVFARQHSDVERTMRQHMTAGIRGDRIEAMIRPHPTKSREKEYFLTPEQQEKAKAFWRRHGIKFSEGP